MFRTSILFGANRINSFSKPYDCIHIYWNDLFKNEQKWSIKNFGYHIFDILTIWIISLVVESL